MAQGFTREVKAILIANGCSRFRQGRGEHEVWIGPRAIRPFVVDGEILSRTVANVVLKQAGLDDRF